ncbi:hypothetical protein TH53_05625 [Pedobacter lusitanus]|uniref:DUF4397 domain-containing protein n=1 Tax=Pedobacter lusitanus TaxID=1503925 RepID=A0A0D0GLF2_9SPHI|nr:DUF4397 domain-containing protein [Pedobacter lusitanus]KIO78072.1 hypothetical protein TH53_05625 [Pedobacter lusitanus]
MKTKLFLKNLLKGTAILSLAVLVSSCKKNDVDSSGSANIKVVNASPSSPNQGFYLANKTVVASGLSFATASAYISTNSGNNLVAEFRSDGSSTAYASGKSDIKNGASYTIFLAGDGQAARVKFFEDDRSAPASGQAKVRFIHLSDGAPANIDIRRSTGENVAANLGRDVATNFTTIAPGILSLRIYAAGQTTSLGSFDLTAFAADKTYTVYITGSTANSISVRQITQE